MGLLFGELVNNSLFVLVVVIFGLVGGIKGG